MRNRRFKKSPPAPREHVQDASIVQHDAVQVEGHDMQLVDSRMLESYKAVMKLLTGIKEDVVPRKVPLFLSRMVMVGVLLKLQLNKVLM